MHGVKDSNFLRVCILICSDFGLQKFNERTEHQKKERGSPRLAFRMAFSLGCANETRPFALSLLVVLPLNNERVQIVKFHKEFGYVLKLL